MDCVGEAMLHLRATSWTLACSTIRLRRCGRFAAKAGSSFLTDQCNGRPRKVQLATRRPQHGSACIASCVGRHLAFFTASRCFLKEMSKAEKCLMTRQPHSRKGPQAIVLLCQSACNALLTRTKHIANCRYHVFSGLARLDASTPLLSSPSARLHLKPQPNLSPIYSFFFPDTHSIVQRTLHKCYDICIRFHVGTASSVRQVYICLVGLANAISNPQPCRNEVFQSARVQLVRQCLNTRCFNELATLGNSP